jgi:hypothetical protein
MVDSLRPPIVVSSLLHAATLDVWNVTVFFFPAPAPAE